VAVILAFWAFLPLFLGPEEEKHGDMEILTTILIVLLLLVFAATVSALLRDGRGHTPPVESHEAWSALDLPSTNYTLRIF
jgi:threonine/homoserine/homoserine lactone efflux protein